jgi:predicted dehydrogenase
MAKQIRVGLIGAGFIARCHVWGYRTMPVAFPDADAFPVLEIACDQTDDLATAAAQRFGAHRSTADWRRLVEDPAVDLVDICVPSNLHREIALAAIAAGKDVYCEKPVGLNAREAQEIAAAADKAGVKSLVGYSYLRNPLVAFARKVIEDGRIGRIIHFRGAHNEDYLADPAHPFIWRCDPAIAGAAGAMGDLGGHIVSIARHLVGEIAALNATTTVVVPERPVALGASERRKVGNEDTAQAMLEFVGGATGHIETSRVASGSNMDITYEIVGTKGAIQFDGERMNELRLYTDDQRTDARGFVTVNAGPAHPPYGAFVPGTGHGLGFNDHKTIEVWELMQLLGAGHPAMPDLADAARIGRVIDAVLESARTRAWVTLPA